MKGIKRIQEAIQAGESMLTDDIVLALIEECFIRDIEPRRVLKQFIPQLKALADQQEKQKAAKECDSLTAKDGMPTRHTNK